MAVTDLPERFWNKVDVSLFCWEWTGYLSPKGYGRYRVGHRMVSAHRVAWEAEYGAVPDGLVLDHIACDNPPCVRPDHMRAVTMTENTLRGNSPQAQNARKTHCHRGHPFDEENTRRETDGKRRCRACVRERPLRRSQGQAA